ncbi:MAG: hypothetical protein ACPGOY_07940 [Rhodospirillaceae bacterium]
MIEITDETADLLARQSSASGLSQADLVAQWARAADAGAEAFRAAVAVGIEQADCGEFSDQTVEEIFQDVVDEYDRETQGSK